MSHPAVSCRRIGHYTGIVLVKVGCCSTGLQNYHSQHGLTHGLTKESGHVSLNSKAWIRCQSMDWLAFATLAPYSLPWRHLIGCADGATHAFTRSSSGPRLGFFVSRYRVVAYPGFGIVSFLKLQGSPWIQPPWTIPDRDLTPTRASIFLETVFMLPEIVLEHASLSFVSSRMSQ